MIRKQQRNAPTSQRQQVRLMGTVLDLVKQKKMTQREAAKTLRQSRGKVRRCLDANAKGRDPGKGGRPSLLTTEEESELISRLRYINETDVVQPRVLIDEVPPLTKFKFRIQIFPHQTLSGREIIQGRATAPLRAP